MQADSLTFSGLGLDRASAARKDGGWVRRCATPRAQASQRAAMACCWKRARHRGECCGWPLAMAPLPSRRPSRDPARTRSGTGVVRSRPRHADPGAPKAGDRDGRLASLRDAGAVLGAREAGLAAYLIALLNWHRAHRFYADCGAPTAIAEAGSSRRCTRFGTEHFPGTDPAVIVLVECERKVLLGRHRDWDPGHYSAGRLRRSRGVA